MAGAISKVKLGVASAWAALEHKFAALYDYLIEKRPILTLIALTLIWLIPGSAQLPFVDRDEPRFAYATQEMMDRGNPVVPFFNGEYRFDKPPLVYWWMKFNYTLFGYNQFSARLHSILAAAAVVLLIFGFGSRLYNKHIGFWAAFAFLTCLQVILHGRLCVADMPMMIFIVSGQWALWQLLNKEAAPPKNPSSTKFSSATREWFWAAIFWLSMSLGFTTKWIVPWAVSGITFILYFCFKFFPQPKTTWKLFFKNLFATFWPMFKKLKPLSGFALMILVILAWTIPAWQSTNGEFFKIGIGEHVFARGGNPFNARHYNPFFYIFSAFLSLMPWIALVGGLIPYFRENWDNKVKFLTAWVGGSYIMFSLAQTQLPHYVLPAFPAFFLLLTAATNLQKSSGVWARRFYYAIFITWISVAALAAFATVCLPAFIEEALRAKLAGVLVIVLLAMLLLLAWARNHGKYFTLSLSFIAAPLCFWGAAAALDGLSPAQQVATFLGQANYPQVLIATGYEEPSLTAYTQSQWIYESDYQKARALYNNSQSAALVVLAQEFTLDNIPQILLKLPLHARRDAQKTLLANPPIGGRRFRMEGVNLGRFSWVTYDLYVKP